MSVADSRAAHSSTASTSMTTFKTWTPRKKSHVQRLRTKVHRLQRKLEYAAKPNPELVSKRPKLEKVEADLSQVLSAATLNFVLGQICVATAKNKGPWWTPQDKALALSLLHSSPKTYRLLQKIFRLPSVKTLSRVMQNMCLSWFQQ